MQRKNLMIAALFGVAVVAAGCKDEDKGAGKGSTPGTSSGNTTPAAKSDAPKAAGHNRIPLGETTVGSLKLVATMDEAVPAAGGGEGAFDLVITGGKPKAVRFWVGTEDGKDSVKAKAEEETTDNWHTHAEVPKPLPAGSKFWAEVEPPTGAPFKVSFDLKVK
jgi:hypothetical protein